MKMTFHEAMQILGLPDGSSLEEINRKYRELARTMHTDVGGPKDEMQRLNEAHRTAEVVLRNEALVPLSTVDEMIATSTAKLTIQNQAGLSIDRMAISQKKQMTGRLRGQRRLATFIGAAAGMVAFLGKDLPPESMDYIRRFAPDSLLPALSQTWPALPVILALYAGVFSLMFWALTRKIEIIEDRYDEFVKYLSTRTNYRKVLSSIVQNVSEWTLDDLSNAVSTWAESKTGEGDQRWRRIAKYVGAEEFSLLLVSKGRELGLLSFEDRLDKHGEEVEYYRL